jgi:hypothetical protein
MCTPYEVIELLNALDAEDAAAGHTPEDPTPDAHWDDIAEGYYDDEPEAPFGCDTWEEYYGLR